MDPFNSPSLNEFTVFLKIGLGDKSSKEPMVLDKSLHLVNLSIILYLLALLSLDLGGLLNFSM